MRIRIIIDRTNRVTRSAKRLSFLLISLLAGVALTGQEKDGGEVIPAVYDSLHSDKNGFFTIAYKDNRVLLLDSLGHIVKDSLKVAVNINMRYQVIDKHNRMYFVDVYGHETDEYRYGVMSVDDQLYYIAPGAHILPKEKNLRDAACWVRFDPPSSYAEGEAIRKERKDDWMYFYYNTVMIYGLYYIMERDENTRAEFERCNINAYFIPKEYKDFKLTNNEQDLILSGDYKQLPREWIIAKKRGKYGVLNIRNREEPVLPFIFDRITGIVNNRTSHLLLERKGLKCYYPLRSDPRYTYLEPFKYHFARFQLPDGRKGWVDFDGTEYYE